MADVDAPQLNQDPPQLNQDPQANLPAEKTKMRFGDDAERSDEEVRRITRITTVPEMRQWLRNWVGKVVGKSPDDIDESAPMVELGLASRDAVAMAADIEDLTGVTLSVAVAFQYPTIESLANRIIEGESETIDDDTDAFD